MLGVMREHHAAPESTALVEDRVVRPHLKRVCESERPDVFNGHSECNGEDNRPMRFNSWNCEPLDAARLKR